MHAERDQLVQSIENQRQHLDDINKKVWQGEITLQKTMDRLEKNVSEFNSILYKLGMSQQELELLVNAKTPEQMTSLDLNQFKSECQCYIQDQKKAIRLIHDEILNLQEQTDTLQWNNQQRQEQIQVLEQSVENLNKRYQEDKTSLGKILSDAQTQFSEYTKQIESLKRESHLLLQQSQHRLTSKQLECDKQEDLLQLNKEKILQELVNGLVDVFGFHQKIQTSLDGLKEMLEE
ncbi:hypothetical protein EDD86DRAFT_74029 [Gorgonomyces haynaldii]|nr:hypothetical protein EDD86DRAFT_74029 [Gorgonomyces haynaldii]